MDDMRVGSALRTVRIRRRWRQEDVAARAGCSRARVSLLERGHLGATSLETLRAVGTVLDIRIDIVPRWRGGELHRLINARHSAMHESVASFLNTLPGWIFAPEVSFSTYGERGVLDILAYHPAGGEVLVIELKTDIVDVNELVGTLDRKARLATRIAEDRGWEVSSVSRWVVVSRDRTNQRRIEAHRAMLKAAFPSDGHAMRSWLTRSSGGVSALSMWTSATPGSASPTRSHRIRVAGVAARRS